MITDMTKNAILFNTGHNLNLILNHCYSKYDNKIHTIHDILKTRLILGHLTLVRHAQLQSLGHGMRQFPHKIAEQRHPQPLDRLLELRD